MVLLVCKGLKKLELLPGSIGDFLVVIAVFIGLGALKFLL